MAPLCQTEKSGRLKWEIEQRIDWQRQRERARLGKSERGEELSISGVMQKSFPLTLTGVHQFVLRGAIFWCPQHSVLALISMDGKRAAALSSRAVADWWLCAAVLLLTATAAAATYATVGQICCPPPTLPVLSPAEALVTSARSSSSNSKERVREWS